MVTTLEYLLPRRLVRVQRSAHASQRVQATENVADVSLAMLEASKLPKCGELVTLLL